jgi:glutamine synthetase
MELRSPDPSCNPYLAFAVMLMSGLDGIKNSIAPPDPVECNIFHLNDEQRRNMSLPLLPGTLKEALDELMKDRVLLDTLGEHIAHRFYETKLVEWNEYCNDVSQWEIEHYLSKF